MSVVEKELYPSINTNIKYQQDWQKDFYHKKLSEFKVSPVGFNKIVFLGNSITQGLLRHTDKLSGNNIVNRGISGDHTDGVLARLEEIIHYKPKAVFLLIGVNDLFEDNRSRPERTPEYVANNIFLISDIINKKSPNTKIYTQTIIPINNNQYLTEKPNIEFLHADYSPSINEQINEVNKNLKRNLSLNIIDLHSTFLNEDLQLNPQFSTDGVHLNDLGYQNWIDIINPILKDIK
jgi:lysophospholipase L1-like esterase